MFERHDPLGSQTPDSLAERLRIGPGNWIPLEEFAPLPRCLEWRLSRLYWDLHGPRAFYGGDVPYASINDGRLSADAARLLAELRPGTNPGPVRILEVGGGSGLFAKLFLDELRLRSPALYDATTYVWTDATPAMVRQAEADGVFADHADRVRMCVLAVPDAGALAREAGDGFDLVIANYLLDNLPATVLRIGGDGLEELEVRATLREDLDPSRLGGFTPHEWAARASDPATPLPDLVNLYPWFSLECRHRPVDAAALPFGALIPKPSGDAPSLWTHHETAWAWLREVLAFVRAGGGVLISDYGHSPLKNQERLVATQHFGGSLANGVNFDELSAFPLVEPDWQVSAPETDAKHLSTRWVGRRADKLPAEIFRLIFDGRRRDRPMELLAEARERTEHGRTEEARWLFMKAHGHAPRCWHVIERHASFCLSHLKDFQAAHDLAETGLRLHPHYPSLWNVKGDALYELKQFAEAGGCYRRAIAINPREVRGRLNLVYVHLETGRYPEALAVLAEALALDREGDFRDALLDKQRQVLLRISVDARDALSQQLNRFRNIDAPG